MSLTLTSEDVNEPTRIKAINPQIIVSGSAEQPYYSIEYYDVEKEQFCIGFSSCYLSTVFKWRDECFDVVAGDVDDIIRNLKADKEALIAGQETLQKALAKKDREVENVAKERDLYFKVVLQNQNPPTASELKAAALEERLRREKINEMNELIVLQRADLSKLQSENYRKQAEFMRLKAENEILKKNADEAFQEGLNENRSLFVKDVIQEIQQVICDNTYPGSDRTGKAVMIWEARTGYDAIKDAVLKTVGDANIATTTEKVGDAE